MPIKFDGIFLGTTPISAFFNGKSQKKKRCKSFINPVEIQSKLDSLRHRKKVHSIKDKSIK